MGQSYSPFGALRGTALLAYAICAQISYCQDAPTLSQEARGALERKEYAKSAELYLAAAKKSPGRVFDWYGAARASALLGHVDEAFRCLGEMAARGYDNAEELRRNPELAGLRSDVRWAALLKKVDFNYGWNSGFWDGWTTRTPYQPNLSEEEKIAGLSKLWSEIKFNFANFDLVPDLRWDQVYLDYLPRVRQTRSTYEYFRLLQEVVAKLHDGHTNVFRPAELTPQFARPPIQTQLIENRVLITGANEQAKQAGVTIGAEILEVDGVPVKAYAESRVMPYISAASPHDLTGQTYRSLLYGPIEKPVELTLADSQGLKSTVSLHRIPLSDWGTLFARAPYEFKMLPGNVAYVYIGAFDVPSVPSQFDKDFPEIAKADALIIDVRDNGGGSDGNWYGILSSLVGPRFRTFAVSTFEYQPVARARGFNPDLLSQVAGGVFLHPKEYRKPVAVLCNVATYSAAEDFLLAFEEAKRGTIVGETSPGSSGQPMSFNLPGGISARVCTMKIAYADGRRFLGVGVKPTLPVSPTVADFRAGRDTILETALAALKKEVKR
jgi:C-terminal processing protease CtpA/Prc